MRIALDVDDVCLEFNKMLCTKIAEEFSTVIDIEDITHWDWWNDTCDIAFPKNNMWEWLKSNPSYWAEAPPMPGALNGIKELKRKGHTVHLVTSKPDWARQSMWAWLAKHNPTVDGITIVTSRGNKLQHPQSKLQAVGHLHDMIIDDKAETCLEWEKTGKAVILFDRPWNRDVEESSNLRRAKNWTEILRLVEMFEQSLVSA